MFPLTSESTLYLITHYDSTDIIKRCFVYDLFDTFLFVLSHSPMICSIVPC